jgi:putative inorganic carbon (hco3(-)) transporter
MGPALTARLLPAALPGTAVLIVLAGTAAAATQEDPARAFAAATLACAAAAMVLMIPYVDAAWPVVLGVGLSIFSGNWDQLGIPIGLDRLLLLPGILAVFVQELTVPAEQRRLRLTGVHVVLGVLAAYAMVSAALAGTLIEREPVFGLLDKLGVVCFLLFVVAPVTFGTARQRSILLGALVAMGGYLGLTAFFETVGADALVYPKYILDDSVGLHAERARGPFADAVAFGLAMYASALAAAIAFVTWREPRARGVAVAVGLLCALGVVFTLTRQVWLGCALATVVTLIAVPSLRRYLVPVVVLAALAVVGTFTVLPDLRETASERASSERPVWDRLNSNRAALEMIQEKPLLGFGWYRFGEESREFYRLGANYPMTTALDRPHHVFLGTAVELGLIGLLIHLAALAVAVGGAILRRGPPDLAPWRYGLLALAIVWFVLANFAPLGSAYANYMLWLWAGVVYAGLIGPVGAPPRAPARTPRS